ncbi:hypothetical protein [Chitinophaga defluvii]|uniref:Uncharacterized protein n=1 Tax=Chitinophaga defluvii TaxID=3163343 RepID=A0ABV2T6N4_9BACT
MKKENTHIEGQSYPMEWLDLIITVTLNPDSTSVDTITDAQATCICTQLDSEASRLKSLLKNKVFSLTKPGKIRLLIRHYHHTLIVLLDHAIANGQHPAFKTTLLQPVQEKAIDTLDNLLSFIETRFAAYLGLEERVPATYLSVVQSELSEQLDKVRQKLQPSLGEKYVLDMVWKVLETFTDPEVERPAPITFADVLYHRELLRSLEQLEEGDRISTRYTLLEETLIGMNFNHRGFISSFTQKTADRVNMQQDLKERITLLALYQKELKQLIAEPDRCYQTGHPGLQTTLDNWFSQELFFLEKKLHLNIVPIGADNETADERKNTYKLLCTLSEDQLGILLKAADDLKVIISRSLSNVFNQIVPYLSTPYKEELSPNSMRSHTYAMEERDKQVVIETLEKMIEKIKEY